MKTDLKAPQRFIDEFPKSEAEAITEIMMDYSSLPETLTRFLTGEIDPRQLAYEIQVIAENADAQIQKPEPEGLENWEHA